MFCPSTRCPDFRALGIHAEYRDELSVCPLCGAALVEGPPQPPDTRLTGERLGKALAVSVTLRPQWFRVALQSLVPGALAPLCLAASQPRSTRALLLAGLSFLLVGLALAARAAVQRFSIQNGIVRYSTLLGQARQAPIDEIQAVHFEAVAETYWEGFLPFPQLLLVVGPPASRREVRVDLSAYRRKHMRKLLDLLKEVGLLKRRRRLSL